VTPRNYLNWGKGKRLKLFYGREATILEDGQYVANDSAGLWVYQIRYTDTGEESRWIPCVGDKIIDDRGKNE